MFCVAKPNICSVVHDVMTFSLALYCYFIIYMQPSIYPISKHEVSMNLACNLHVIDLRSRQGVDASAQDGSKKM